MYVVGDIREGIPSYDIIHDIITRENPVISKLKYPFELIYAHISDDLWHSGTFDTCMSGQC